MGLQRRGTAKPDCSSAVGLGYAAKGPLGWLMHQELGNVNSDSSPTSVAAALCMAMCSRCCIISMPTGTVVFLLC